jgi:hypothetical protein
VAETDLSFWSELSEAERMHFRHLVMIRTQIPSESQTQHLAGLAANLTHPRLLTLMSRTPLWLSHWPVLEGLAQNEATPEAIRRDLEMVVSLFDLMREMDSAPAGEKVERAEMVKTVYQQLRPDLKPVAKLLAKQLARPIGGGSGTLEMPPLPDGESDWEALTLPPEPPAHVAPTLSREEMLARASGTEVPAELLSALLSNDGDLRHAGLLNPLLTEELLCQALQQGTEDAFFDEVYGEARWYFREPLRSALLNAPRGPEDLCRRVALSRHLVELLGAGRMGERSVQRAVSLFAQLDESEYQYLTYWCKRHAPNLLRVVKYFFDRLRRQRSGEALGARENQGQWASLEERVFQATQTTQPDTLLQLLRDPDTQVFKLTLENPALVPKLLATVIPVLERERVEFLAAHFTWNQVLEVREALLHNPHLSEPLALDLLRHLTQGLKPLVEVLRDPRIPHLEVKRQALERLRAEYQATGPDERLGALRSFGAELMRHLPQEVLQDEATLRLLVSDRQLDPSLLLRLARNKLTPRAVLEQIAAHPVLLAHTAIMSELLLNPKTPRESALRLWGLLSDSEQQQLLKSPHLPTTLRHLA